MTQLNLEPLKRLGLTDQQIQMILAGMTDMLRIEVENELDRVIGKETMQALDAQVKDEKDINAQVIAYNKVYSEKTGRNIQDFSDEKLNEFIVMASEDYKKYMNYAQNLSKLPEEEIKKMNEDVEKGDYTKMDSLINNEAQSDNNPTEPNNQQQVQDGEDHINHSHDHNHSHDDHSGHDHGHDDHNHSHEHSDNQDNSRSI